LGWDNLVGTEGLFRIDEGREDLACLLAFAYRLSGTEQSMAMRYGDLLFIEEGRGLLMSGMLGERDGGDIEDCRRDNEQKGTRRGQDPGYSQRERVGQAQRHENESRAIEI